MKPAKGPKALRHAPIADFDDTIARNRGLSLMAPEVVPEPPRAYRPTDPEVRNRRLRRISAGLRAEACAALVEAGGNDLQGDLGRFAPAPESAPALAERLEVAARLVANAERLVEYAREMDQIAMSDALVFLETEHKLLALALPHEPALRLRYRAVLSLFDQRAMAIVEGLARAKANNGKAREGKGPDGETNKATEKAASPASEEEEE